MHRASAFLHHVPGNRTSRASQGTQDPGDPLTELAQAENREVCIWRFKGQELMKSPGLLGSRVWGID
jgi:hypothetical protein